MAMGFARMGRASFSATLHEKSPCSGFWGLSTTISSTGASGNSFPRWASTSASRTRFDMLSSRVIIKP